MQTIEKYRFWNELKKLPYVDAIYLYGSRARGDHRPRSDIDLAILCPRANQSDWRHIMDVIEDADTLLAIDVVRLDELPEGALKSNIMKQKKLIYGGGHLDGEERTSTSVYGTVDR